MGSDQDSLKREMLTALKEKIDPLKASDGRSYAKADMQRLLQEWIPTSIVVKRVSEPDSAIVIAAPHVSFDNWTEYFANRVAYDLKCGEVLAKNFRDDDGGLIPCSIGRHIHVNRPTESKRKGGVEHETPRAMAAFQKYRSALHEAGGMMPLMLLIELHGHRKHGRLEVATTGIDALAAKAMKEAYEALFSDGDVLPELAIEPLDELRFNAQRTKANGAMSHSVCRAALHVEIPRSCRESETARERFRPILSSWLSMCIATINPYA